jgi:response regulator RpfG family c-di-GMP phosphodiesterase
VHDLGKLAVDARVWQKQGPLTADELVQVRLHHYHSAYRKIGVSTRAGATLFAMEHGLMAWGELPISRPAVRP